MGYGHGTNCDVKVVGLGKWVSVYVYKSSQVKFCVRDWSSFRLFNCIFRTEIGLSLYHTCTFSVFEYTGQYQKNLMLSTKSVINIKCNVPIQIFGSGLTTSLFSSIRSNLTQIQTTEWLADACQPMLE